MSSRFTGRGHEAGSGLALGATLALLEAGEGGGAPDGARAYILGLAFGRLTALREQAGEEPDASVDLALLEGFSRRLLPLVSGITFFEPGALSSLLVTCDPADLCSVLLLWPDGQPSHRLFLAGVLAGLWLERFPGTGFLTARPDILPAILSQSGLDQDLIDALASPGPDTARGGSRA